MNPRWRGSARPPWWPANEPWPPAGQSERWRRGRSRFVRRAGCLFAFILMLSALGGVTLISAIFGGFERNWMSGPLPLLVMVVFFGLAAMLVVFVGAMRRFGRPMGDIVAAADRVATGDFSTRVDEHGPPWLRTVAGAFNKMTSALQSHDEQRRHLMADVAHELRTPIAVIQGRLEGLLDGVYPRDDAQLSGLVEDTRILGRLVEDLRTLANAESGTLRLQKEPTDLVLLAHDAVRTCSSEAVAKGVILRAEDSKDVPIVDVDPLRLREVLTNLLFNAIRHTAQGGLVTLAVEATDQSVILTIRDTGTGIAPADLPKIFDRFYKGSGSSGSGLGLTIARNLVTAHGGEIQVDSQVGVGTTMKVRLPV